MANKQVKHPGIPRGNDKKSIDALAHSMETLTGAKGDILKKALTWGDLEKAGMVNVIRSLTRTPGINRVVDTQVSFTPTAPTNFEAIPTFTRILLKWDRASYTNHAFTEIYRGEVDVLSASEFIGSTVSGAYTDEVNSNTSYYYWARHVNDSNVPGPYNDTQGTLATTFERPIDVLNEYSKDIYAGENFAFLRSNMSIMEALDRAYQAAGLGADSSLRNALSNADSISDLLAEQAMVGALDKHSTSQSIKAQFSNNFSKMTGNIRAVVDINQTYVFRLQEMESYFENELGNAIIAGITNFEGTYAGEAGAFATNITDYKVVYNGGEATLQELAQVTANNDNNIATTQWGVKSNINDIQAGVGFYQDSNGKSSFIINATEFAVVNATDSFTDNQVLSDSLVPFVIRDDRTVIKEAFIDIAVITELIAERISANEVNVTIKLFSPVIEAGSIVGSTIDVGGGDKVGSGRVSIDSQGNLTAINVDLTGKIKATSGELDNVTINESCKILGTLNANNINGDVLDRSVVVVRESFEHSGGRLNLITGNIVPGVIGATNDRVLVISGICLDHQNGSGSDSHFTLDLYFDDEIVQTYVSRNVGEEGTDTPQLGCLIPASNETRSFAVTLNVLATDNIMIQQSAIVADVFKVGSTIQNVSGMYAFGVTDPSSFKGNPVFISGGN
jgi:hypothetical protein